MTEPPVDHRPDPPVRTIRADLGGRREGRLWRVLASGLLGLTLLLALGAAVGWRAFLSDLPPIPPRDALWSQNRVPGMAFQDHNGQPIANRGPRHGQRARLKALPPHVARAFLAAEDHRFYRHGPVDLQGVGRALWANVTAGEVVQGGSTLTQQLAKVIWLTPEQTFKRKIQEAVLAWRLEQLLSKDEVLELYLNRIFFGANAYGVDAAAQTYFGKSPTQLTLGEAALLAALPKAPSRLRPTRDPEAAWSRARVVLRRMREEGWITAAAEAAAGAAPPALTGPAPAEGDYGYALDLAAAQAQALVGDQAPDLIVRLTIDPGLQATAAQLVRGTMAGEGARRGARQAALVALAPDGAIRALVGGLDHEFSPFDRATQARRQPGSAFKPFIFAAALEARVRPCVMRADAPVRLGPWSPQNYGGGFRGQVTVEQALIHSINTVSVRLAQEVRPKAIGDLAHRFGFAGVPARPEPSVALGAYEVSLLELAGAYQVFQQGGRRFPPFVVERITTAGGRLLYERRPSGALQVYDPALSAQMVRMMRGVVERGTGRRAGFGRPAAGKTGTSQNFRDAWFVGFTPDWTAGVWVGNDDNRSMSRVTGGELPAQIWRRFMIAAHKDLPVHSFPAAPTSPPPQAAPPLEEAPPPVEAEPRAQAAEGRADFYDELNDAFGQEAR